MKITKKQLRKIIKETRMARPGTMPMRSRASEIVLSALREEAVDALHEDDLELWSPEPPAALPPGIESGDDNLRSTARLRKALESGDLDWLDDFKSSAVMRHLDQMGRKR